MCSFHWTYGIISSSAPALIEVNSSLHAAHLWKERGDMFSAYTGLGRLTFTSRRVHCATHSFATSTLFRSSPPPIQTPYQVIHHRNIYLDAGSGGLPYPPKHPFVLPQCLSGSSHLFQCTTASPQLPAPRLHMSSADTNHSPRSPQGIVRYGTPANSRKDLFNRVADSSVVTIEPHRRYPSLKGGRQRIA
ncbi:hypothetical protein BV22DRAFT_24125 [Leucogyrophana mollusca]|uniref:Uncharacterized protein n=1 Tax=Leucogyrophana mollusca TaxID=85980 RepID=A0ACB8BYJ1_9AGAM|nr:hypothetical protein BV22DRAFT_24125 [Leucogyrophana mollusca]